MFQYQAPDGTISHLSETTIALKIMADPNAEHLIQLDNKMISWNNVSAIVDRIKSIRTEEYPEMQNQNILYAGPDIVGTCSLSEIITRICDKPNEVHLINQMSLHYNSMKIRSWTFWRNIQPLHAVVKKKCPDAPSYQPKRINLELNTSVKLDSKRTNYNPLYRSREGAFEELSANYDPQILHHSTKYLSGRALYAWGGIDCEPVWDRDVATAMLGHLKYNLRISLKKSGKLKLPGIGTLKHIPDRSTPVSMRMLPSFSKKLNGHIPIDPKQPLWKDGLHNLSYWKQLNTTRLSALRKLTSFSSDTTHSFLLVQHFFEFVSYWLWCGYNVTIPHFGTFKLRKGCGGTSHRTVRFKCSKQLCSQLSGNQS